MMTWAKLSESLPEGLPVEAVELIRRHTAPQRHEARVVAAGVAAMEKANTLLEMAPPMMAPDKKTLTLVAQGYWQNYESHRAPHQAQIAALLCRIEATGLGGRHGIMGNERGCVRSTFRADWAQTLGSGRALARDGQAWTAAIQDAGNRLAGGLWEARQAGILPMLEPADLAVGDLADLELIASPQARAEAGRCMLAAFDRGDMAWVQQYGEVFHRLTRSCGGPLRGPVSTRGDYTAPRGPRDLTPTAAEADEAVYKCNNCGGKSIASPYFRAGETYCRTCGAADAVGTLPLRPAALEEK